MPTNVTYVLYILSVYGSYLCTRPQWAQATVLLHAGFGPGLQAQDAQALQRYICRHASMATFHGNCDVWPSGHGNTSDEHD